MRLEDLKELEKLFEEWKKQMEEPKTPVKCHKCGYLWGTRSKRLVVTCPSCKTSVKNLLEMKRRGWI